jgi:hypothetical protein
LREQLVSKPNAFELRDLLDCELLFETGENDQELLFLGDAGDESIGRPAYRATPFFRTLDELEAFCAQHLERYQVIDIPKEGVPTRWFWEQSEPQTRK